MSYNEMPVMVAETMTGGKRTAAAANVPYISNSTTTRPELQAPSKNPLLTAALGYALAGIPVIPLRGKAPAIPSAHPKDDPLHGKCRGECGRLGHGVYDATTDPEQVADLWQAAGAGVTGVGWAQGIQPDGTRTAALDPDREADPAELARYRIIRDTALVQQVTECLRETTSRAVVMVLGLTGL